MRHLNCKKCITCLLCTSFFIGKTMRLRIQKLLAILLLFSGVLSATSRVVGPQEKIKTIAEALATSAPGDTVFIQPGTYQEETIYIDKPMVIIGRGYPVIDGMNKGYVLEVHSDSVTVKGLLLINVQKSYTKAYAAIHVYGSKYFVIEGNKLRNSFFGILVERSKDGIIHGNTVMGNAVTEQSSGNGIHAWHSDRLTISNNHVEGMRDGIYLEFVNNSKIIGNVSRNNIRYGLHFMFSNDDLYLKNRFENNGAGVAVMFSKRIDMRENEFMLNWGSASYGLLLKEILEGEIVGNTFNKNTIGISADGASKISFSHNNFDNNGWAIRFHGACYDNNIVNNNFRHNALDISYKGPMNGNIFDQNYWSEYAGYDLDKNNVGDVPYRPVKLFSYVVNKTPETIILLRSLFVDIINFSEKVSPIMTPDNLKDNRPLMKPVKINDRS